MLTDQDAVLTEPSEEIEIREHERRRRRVRWINRGWMMFIVSPLIFLRNLWLPTGIANPQGILACGVSPVSGILDN